MSTDQYIFSPEKLIICDPELDIELTLECSLPRLPSNLEGRGVVKSKGAAYLVKEGWRHGECRLFTEDGKVRAEMFYLYGKLHGPSTMYAEQGGILSKTWYCEGKKIGKAHFYSDAGALISLQRFKNGEWEGVQEYFYAGGAVKSLIPFRQGKLHGHVQLFWESGIPKRSAHYAEGLREGKDCLWNEQKILIDEGEYRSGKPIGIHRHYDAAGKLKEEFHYHTPVRFDRKAWNENGKLIFEGVFAPDLTYTERVFLEPHGAKVRKGAWDGNCIRWK
jgi:antitoxin component YwqK of YwqJK toxin-antitoxin module